MNNTRIYFNNELVLLKELGLNYYIYIQIVSDIQIGQPKKFELGQMIKDD